MQCIFLLFRYVYMCSLKVLSLIKKAEFSERKLQEKQNNCMYIDYLHAYVKWAGGLYYEINIVL